MRIPWKYIVRRLLYLAAVVWLAATINFVLPRLAAHDPVLEHLIQMEASTGRYRGQRAVETLEEYREWAGLNKPLWQQYFNYMGNMLNADFGRSIRSGRTVGAIVGYALPWTIGLLGTTTLFAFAIGTVLGALSAWRKDARLLNLSVSFLMILAVIPPFIIALVLADILAFRLKLFPLAGVYTYDRFLHIELTNLNWWLDAIYHATLPGLSILFGTLGMWAMGMRGMMVTVLGADFIMFAEAKGVKPIRLLLQYAVRNVMLPQTTALALSLGSLVSGATIVEMIFGYPGVGSVLEEAIRSFDYNLIQGCVFFLILAIAVATFIIDLIYPLLDPRISYHT